VRKVPLGATTALVAIALTIAQPPAARCQRGERGGLTRAVIEAAGADAGRLRALLDDGAPVDVRSRARQTPLGEAAERGNVESLRLLLQRGAAADTPAKANRTPLALAVLQARVETARALIEAGADPLAGGPARSAVQIAAARARSRSFETLVQAVGEAPVRQTVLDAMLVRAAAAGRQDRVAELLELGARAQATAFGESALFAAVTARHAPLARLLLEHGAAPDARARGAATPLDLAVRQDDLDMVATLTLAGASWERTGQNTLARRARMALRGADGAVVLALERAGAIDRRDTEGMTLLMRAAQSGVVTMVRALLERGAAVDAQRWVPAASASIADRANFFADDAEAQRPSDGWTALMLAAAAGQARTAGELLQAGADVNHRSAAGRTALMVATLYGHGALVAQLLDAGADKSLQDEHGESAATLAETGGRVEIGALLGVAVSAVPEKPKPKTQPAEASDKSAAPRSEAAPPRRGSDAAAPPRDTRRAPAPKSRGAAVPERQDERSILENLRRSPARPQNRPASPSQRGPS